MWIIYDFLNIPRSAVVRAEAIRKAGGELIAVAAQQLVNADKLKALLCERVDRAQNCRDRSVLCVVQEDYIPVARMVEKPVVDILLVDMHQSRGEADHRMAILSILLSMAPV